MADLLNFKVKKGNWALCIWNGVYRHLLQQIWSNSTALSGNIAYNYLPAAGAYLQSVINGYGGIRLRSNRLSINAVLPPGVTRMSFVGIDYRGSQLNVIVSKSEIMVIMTSSHRNAPLLRLFVYNPDETHTLKKQIEVRFSRRSAEISTAELLSQFPALTDRSMRNITDESRA